ncbi:MAG TPA: hypothetical protein DCZ12_12040 [Gammaproteobacteria bacterium]|nr:hypothetical protein [Gammaproteobacteria bacterium]
MRNETLSPRPRVQRDRRFVIGIDPDLSKSGVGIVRDGKLVDMLALNFPLLLRMVSECLDSQPLIILEDVETDSTTYHRAKTNHRQHARIAQNVGQVKGVKRVLVECLEDMGATVVQVKPMRGGVKGRAKTDADFFNRITGWEGRTNEDKRDAAMLALWA